MGIDLGGVRVRIRGKYDQNTLYVYMKLYYIIIKNIKIKRKHEKRKVLSVVSSTSKVTIRIHSLNIITNI